MVQFSNKPNMKGIKNTSAEIDRSSKLIGRQGRLWAGLYQTRISGIAYGLILAFVLVLIIPLIVKLCGM
jgi:tetrahydromethanopterin S-methyltransferase subunit F